MRNWFDNLGVTYKLGLGFGLVLCLTALLAVGDWISRESLLQRSQAQEVYGALNESLAELRLSLQDYLLDGAKAASEQRLGAALDDFERQQAAMRARKLFARADLLALEQQQGELVGDYRQALGKLQAANHAASAVRDEMAERAERAFKAHSPPPSCWRWRRTSRATPSASRPTGPPPPRWNRPGRCWSRSPSRPARSPRR
ncbi:hypothetical protein J2T41_002094 [Pseudomonas citronellolis]|nr:hypothetical protein [Pseudomonas citronellolis]MCP1665400.1 hypothetical protein [Pseudomonas citronellolis]MCP1696322.1 hypothetical protein [Pseudomonas citronellolis]MCP1702937.1 hypothetical protein [Pseudomonas citronellolis]MCP1797102.1 hypothetical protein [Pseudomonas citronellolis]